MDTIEALTGRHSVRDFTSTPIPRDLVLRILELAAQAPSSGNYQPWEVFVAAGPVLEAIRRERVATYIAGKAAEPEVDVSHFPSDPPVMLERLTEMYQSRWRLRGFDPANAAANRRATGQRAAAVFNAPVLLLLCMHRGLNPFTVFDLGLFAQSIALVARCLGVDSLIAAGLATQPDISRRALSIPDDLRIVIGMALGHADKDSAENGYRSPRRPIGEVVTFHGM